MPDARTRAAVCLLASGFGAASLDYTSNTHHTHAVLATLEAHAKIKIFGRACATTADVRERQDKRGSRKRASETDGKKDRRLPSWA